jgi:hypothetical protein
MNNILSLQSMDVSFLDDGAPLSDMSCPAKGSQITVGCSTSSNMCDIAGMGEHYF